MKVIDLLNKIANGEEVPKKIKYRNDDFIYLDGDYSNLNTHEYFSECFLFVDNLNDEVEIIEEDREIEIFNLNEEDIHDLTLYNATENEVKLHRLCCKLANKINELVNELNRKED